MFFSKHSNGVLKGVIGALDDWLVKIPRPYYKIDSATNPVPYYSHKGYYGLNVQCIVDYREKVLWVKFNDKGASRDSTCFKNLELYKILKEVCHKLYDEQFFS